MHRGEAARAAFDTAWREYLPKRSDADFEEWRQDAARHAANCAVRSAPHRNEFLPAGLNPGAVAESRMSWERPFDQPVPLPSGPPARTLRDAANYTKKLSETERDTPEWRLAIQMLIDAAEDRGPMLFAKMGIHRAVTATLSASLTRRARIRIGDAASWHVTDERPSKRYRRFHD